MNRSLSKLFVLLGNNELVCSGGENLFGLSDKEPASVRKFEQADIDFLSGYFGSRFNPSILCESARRLFDLSVYAFSAFVHAWMSELPVETEMIGFGRRIIAEAAEKAAADLGDENTRTVQAAAYKVQKEIHRMMGFLRFSPDEKGIFIARCEPDHFVLPALGEYLTSRFGETAWAVIDEKRGLCLSRLPPEQAKTGYGETAISVYGSENNGVENTDEWEELWKHYHKTINNESRKNTGLQRQLMPKRYWKYLPETSL